jgi:hypothetical protein
MVAKVRKTTHSTQTKAAEKTVVYRGIKITLMGGKPSPVARLIRDGLRAKYEHARAAPDPE